jgi:catechol 2,3-dioxygenase-like lactoylglutathione lyase family enzyme
MTDAPSPQPGAWRLDRTALNVSDLDRSVRFYCEALRFVMAQQQAADPALAALLGVPAVRTARLRRGRQAIELSQCFPPGAPMPGDSHSNDEWFQHCALVTDDIARDYQILQRCAFKPISRAGPQRLPGGITAFKFRDPDGHPLELIAFPAPDPATAGGIDHAAICVADPARSIAFYAARLGLVVSARQVNRGPAQDALDDLDDAIVDVVALAPAIAAPHVELLGYRQPRGNRSVSVSPSDIVSSRLVFASAGTTEVAPAAHRPTGGDLALLRDPDGHAVLCESAWGQNVVC